MRKPGVRLPPVAVDQEADVGAGEVVGGAGRRIGRSSGEKVVGATSQTSARSRKNEDKRTAVARSTRASGELRPPISAARSSPCGPSLRKGEVLADAFVEPGRQRRPERPAVQEVRQLVHQGGGDVVGMAAAGVERHHAEVVVAGSGEAAQVVALQLEGTR